MVVLCVYIQKKSVDLQPVRREQSGGDGETMVYRDETAHVEVDRRPLNPSERIRLEGTQSDAAKTLWQRRPPLHDRNDLAQRRDGEVPEERRWPLPRRSVRLVLLPARDDAQAGSERGPSALGGTITPRRISPAFGRAARLDQAA